MHFPSESDSNQALNQMLVVLHRSLAAYLSYADPWVAYGNEKPLLVPFGPDQTSCSDAIGQARDAGAEFIDFEIDAGHVINCGVEAQLQGYKPSKGWGGYLIGVPVIHAEISR